MNQTEQTIYGAPSHRTRNEEYDEKWSVLIREEYKVSWNFKSTLIELYYNFEDRFAPIDAGFTEKFKDLGITPPVDDHKRGSGNLELKYRQVEKIIDKL